VKTYLPNLEEKDRAWYLVDASGETLGRLATRIAMVLRGKHKPIYSPDRDNGDHVVVINAAKVYLSGKKMEQKEYFRHGTRPGSGKIETVAHMMAHTPEKIIERAVRGMLPHNKLGRKMYRKLRVYAGETHPHAGQNPTPIDLTARGGE